MRPEFEQVDGTGQPRTRLYIDAPLTANGGLALDGDRVHYLRNVLRLQTGAALRLFNGRDGEWRGRIARLAKGAADIAVEARLREQAAECDLWLAFAPIKRT